MENMNRFNGLALIVPEELSVIQHGPSFQTDGFSVYFWIETTA